MFIAVFVGVLSGIIGMACWFVIQLILNMPGVYGHLGGNWALIPTALGVAAAALHTLARMVAGHHNDPRNERQALSDLFESYHFGVFILHPLNWVARGVVSLLNALLGGTFGLEGGVIELTYSTLPLLSRYFRLFIDEKQVFVICTIAASISVALGAPFSGGLIAIELVHVLNAKVRRGAVVSALTAYGTALLFQSTVLSSFFVETSVERLNILGSLFAGFRPLNIEVFQWVLLSLAAVCVGMGSGVVAAITSQALSRGSAFATGFFRSRYALLMIMTGLLIGVAVWFVPNSYTEPWRMWEELAWLRISTPNAVILFVTEWVVLILAFSGWGSTGLFSPMLLLGALLGYSIGNAVGSTWAIPLAIAGAASMVSSSFRIPLAASALVLEIGHDGTMWWLSTLAVLSSSLLLRSLRVKPCHEILLERHGLRVVNGRAASLLANLKAKDAMFYDVKSIHEHSDFQELRAASIAAHHNFIGVVGADEKYLGLLSMEQLPTRVRRVLGADAKPADILAVERVVEVRDLIDAQGPIIGPEDSLEKALELLHDTICIAVVDENRKLCGLLFESAIVGLYKREIARSVIKQG